MLDVGEYEFLMLLLVMEAQGNAIGNATVVQLGNKSLQRIVDKVAIFENLARCRPRQHSAPGTRMPRAERLIVRIEEKVVALVERTIAGRVRQQDNALEEPCGMGEVPFRGAGVGHRLDRLILRRQRTGQPFGETAHLPEQSG